MSIPLGGFHFVVGFQTQGANQALGTLRQNAAATAEAVKAAFAGVGANVNVQGTVQAFAQVTQAARAAQAAGRVTMNVKAEGAQVVAREFTDLTQAAAALGRQSVNLQVRLNAQQLAGDLSGVERIIGDLQKGQSATFVLRANADQAKQVVDRFEKDTQAAVARGANVKFTIDTAGAARDQAQLEAQQLASAKRVADEATNQARKAADAQKSIDRETARAKADATRQANAAQREAERMATKINVTLEGGDQATVGLKELLGLARELTATKVNLTIRTTGEASARELQNLRTQLDALTKGQNFVLNIRATAPQAYQTIKAVEDQIKAAEARGATIRINVTPPPASAFQGIQQVLTGGLRGLVAGSGIGGNLLIGAGLGAAATGALAAAVAVQKLTEAVVGGVKAGVEYNAELQQSTQAFTLFTGGVETANKALAGLRRYADVTPFNTKEVIASGQAFALVSAGNIQYLQRQVELAGQLAATNPEQGLEGATRALRELQGGQVESIANRFNVPREVIQHLKDLGLAGEDLERAVVKAAGGSDALVRAYGESFTGRMSTAKAALDEFGRQATKPIFDVLTKGLEGFNRDVDQNKAAYEGLARTIGEGGGQIVRSLLEVVTVAAQGAKALADFSKESKILFDNLNSLSQGKGLVGRPKPAPEAPPTPEQEQNQASSNIAIANRDAAERDLGKQKRLLQDVEDAQKRVAYMVAFTTEQYEKQLRPLEAQLALVQQQIRANDAKIRRDDSEIRAAQAPVADRAAAAGAEVLIKHEQDLAEIRQRRIQMGQELKDLEAQIADRAVEASIRTAQAELKALQDIIAARQAERREAIDAYRAEQEAAKALRDTELQALRDRVRADQEARARSLEGLREELQARQTARQEKIEADREAIQAAQDARQRVLEGVQEEIRARRAAYQEQRDIQQEVDRQAEESYARQARAAERANQAVQEGFRKQIEALQTKDAALRKEESLPTPAERELKALEAAHTEQERARSITSAIEAVRTARTGAERRSAVENLRTLQQQQAYDRQREALQRRADAEKEARELAAEKRQEAIAALQKQAADADRKYQEQRRAADDKHQAEQDARQDAARKADAAERALERDEDARVRAIEAANKEADRQEQAKIRAEEKADRELQRQEQAQIKAAEQADREARRQEEDRIRVEEEKNRQADKVAATELARLEREDREKTRGEQATIRQRELEIEQETTRLRDEQNARQVVADAVRLANLIENQGLEQKILDIKQQILDKTDAARLAAATAQKVIDEEEGKRLASVAAGIQAQIDGIKQLEQAALEPYLAIQKSLDLQHQWLAIQAEDIQHLIDRTNLYIHTLGEEAQKMGEIALQAQQAAADAERIQAAMTEASKVKLLGFDMGQIATAGQRIGGGPLAWIFGGAGEGLQGWINSRMQDLGKWVGEGLRAWFVGDTATPKAAEDWAEKTATAAEAPWLVNSPSKRMADLADNIALGFTGQMAAHEQEMAESLERPFIDFQEQYLPAFWEALVGNADSTAGTWLDAYNAHRQEITESLEQPLVDFQEEYLPAFWEKLKSEADDTAGTWLDAYNLHHAELVASLEAPFIEFQDQYMPEFELRLGVQAAESAKAFTDGWVAFGWAGPIQTGINSVFAQLATNTSAFNSWGQSAAAQWCAGWATAMANCNCSTCAGRGEAPSGGGGKNAPPSTGNPGGTNTSGPSWRTLPPGTVVPPGQDPFLVREVGDVLPRLAVDRVAVGAGTSATGGGGGSSISHGPVSVQVNNEIHANGITDPAAFAQQITDKTVAAIIDVFDQAQQKAPAPVERYLPGGR